MHFRDIKWISFLLVFYVFFFFAFFIHRTLFLEHTFLLMSFVKYEKNSKIKKYLWLPLWKHTRLRNKYYYDFNSFLEYYIYKLRSLFLFVAECNFCKFVLWGFLSESSISLMQNGKVFYGDFRYFSLDKFGSFHLKTMQLATFQESQISKWV